MKSTRRGNPKICQAHSYHLWTASERTWLYNSGAGRSYAELAVRHAVRSAVTAYPCPAGETCDHDQAQTGVNNTYGYDANGNQTTRTINGVTLTLAYDAEGHLVSVTGPSLTATFTYDGDGKRVKSTINGTSTYFVGGYYEVTGSTVTKYYYAGSQRVAMREGSTLYYLLTDHLGSTSLTTDNNGSVVSELRYSAWGGVRSSSGATPTNYQFDGQYSYASQFGLLYFNARWVDPQLGRFSQADNLIPEVSQGTQAWDRYAFVNNNPVRYNDPTGHCAGLVMCIFQITKVSIFLGKQFLQAKQLTDQDFRNAADYAAPAFSDGSKESVSISGSMVLTGIASKTLITTDDGGVQVYNEQGYGGGLPGATLSLTHGQVHNLETPLDYEGGATQGNLGIPVHWAGGISLEGYISDGSSRKAAVWGEDAGIYFGVGPQMLGAGHTTAKPTNNGHEFIPRRLNGPALLLCRLASMCGGL